MKKIFVIIGILFFCYSLHSQTIQASKFLGGKIRLSDSLNVVYPYSLLGSGTSAYTIFRVNATTGEVKWTINSNDILEYDLADGNYFQFKYGMSVLGDIDLIGSYQFKINGIPLSSGGGDAYIGNRQTFTKRNIFDTLSVGINVSDFVFLKGSNTWVYTKDAYALFLGSNSDTAIKIDSLNSVRFYESISVDNQINANEINVSGSLTNLTGTTTLNGVTMNGTYDGTGGTFNASNINAGTIDPARYDTTVLAHTTTGTTETFLSKLIMSATATFNDVVTFASDVIFSGWRKNQSSTNSLQYEKSKIVPMLLATTNCGVAFTTSAAHGLDWRYIRSYTAIVKEDSLNYLMPAANNVSTPLSFSYYYIDSLNCYLRLTSAAVGLCNDSAFFYIIYTDPAR